jgi:tetratricopeptide (TPR) repeat protein
LGTQLDTVPLLAYAYAESLVKTGDVEQGMIHLEHLEAADPSLAIVPAALGEAFAGQKLYQKSAVQFRAALRLNPTDKNAKYDLALTLIALGQKDEAQSLLKQLAQPSETNDPAIYYQLGKLQLDRGDDIDGAIRNLEAAAKLAPEDGATRLKLMEAYRVKGEAGKTAKANP